MIKITQDRDELYYRNKAFLHREEVDRPLFGAHIWDRQFKKIYKETNNTIPQNGEVKPSDIVTKFFIKDIDRIILMHEKIGGDLLWPVVPYVFIPWMEAIIGCQIFSVETSFYTKPFINTWDDFYNDVDISENNKWLSKLVELQLALVEHLGNRYPSSSSTHLRGPVDMMSAALGQTRLPIELYDNPDKIKEMSSIYSEVFIDVAQIQNKIASESKFGGYTVNGYGVWSPHICQYFQDDAMAFLSPKFYKDFVLENHIKIINNFDSTFYHLHPISLFIIDELIKMEKLDIIEVNREPEIIGPSISELLPTFKKIQDHGKSLLINFTQGAVGLKLFEEEVKIICENLSYKGLCIYIMADDTEDGIAKMNIVRRVIRK